MPRRLAIVAAPLLLTALLLSGCTPEPRIPAAEPQPTATPLFASDEEALAAATAAYEEYLAVLGAASSNPADGVSAVQDLVTPEHFAELQSSIDDLAAAGIRADGSTSLVGTKLQHLSSGSDGNTTVVLYACIDVSNVRLVNLGGVDITPADRVAMNDLEVTFESLGAPNRQLLVSRSESWPAGTVCGG